jgi:hypothetical protein
MPHHRLPRQLPRQPEDASRPGDETEPGPRKSECRVFTGDDDVARQRELEAPPTLSSFPRSFARGTMRQLDAMARQLLAKLTLAAPLLPGAKVLALLQSSPSRWPLR